MAVPDPAQRLLRRLDADETRLRRYADYYAGRQRLAFATEKFRETFGGAFGTLASNWCQLVVDAVEERLDVQGFRFGDEAADRDAWAIWQANNMDLDSHLGHVEALVTGRAFVMVWADDDGRPTISVESPRQVAVAHAPGNPRRRTLAVKRWVDDDERAYLTVYGPDEIVRYRSVRKVTISHEHDGPVPLTPIDWEPRGEPIANPLGVVPVIPLVNRPRLLGSGESEIANVLPLQDALNKLLADLLVASEFSALRQRWATGLEIPTDPETNQPVEPFTSATARLWISEDPETKFGDLGASDLSNYVSAVEMLVSHLASQTQTPAHYVYGMKGQFPSGESIKSAEAGLIAKVRRRMRGFSEGWEEAMRLAFAVLNDPRAGVTDAETIWANPETRSESELADALTKRAALGVPAQQLWADLGYSPQQIERFRQMQRQQTLDLASFDAAALPFLTTETTDEP